MRRLITSACLAFLFVSFGFILLAMLNSEGDGELVRILRTDANVIATMCVIGLCVTIILALRILIDGKRRRDLEQIALKPRRKSDIVNPGARS